MKGKKHLISLAITKKKEDFHAERRLDDLYCVPLGLPLLSVRGDFALLVTN